MDSTNTILSKGMLLGLGNPLLDVIAKVDQNFLKKYNLKANDAILANEDHKLLIQHLEENFQPEYFVGGATQNSMRVAQWLVGTPEVFAFMGCVGEDKYAKMLEQKARQDGVDCRYQHDEAHPTGSCAVLLSQGGSNRSLVTFLGASENFTTNHLHTKENEALIRNAGYFYVSSFFYSPCVEAVLELSQEASRTNKVFCLNLSAPFLCDVYKSEMAKTMPYADIVFGNDDEARAFAKHQDFNLTDVNKIALKITELPKANKRRNRVVVITQGADHIVLATGGSIRCIPVTKIPKEDIVDTNGAGDSFVGGFLAQLVQGRSMEDCLKCGIWAASQIIQQIGCNCPTDKKYPY